MKIFILFAALASIWPKEILGQADDVYDRYASAWVVGSAKPNELLPFDLKNKQASLQLVIPQKDRFYEMPNGNRFLNAYLINNAVLTTEINRAGATVSTMTTEIWVDGEWRVLQVKLASLCGNSYWKMSLGPKQFLALQIDHMIGGTAEVQFRVCYHNSKRKIASNPVTLAIRKELIPSAGTVPTYAERDR